uniref:Uncharacterized protein n=1 Tax=Euplotes harpa TaxID=151035 RepID=A0A7S3JLR9_9SPIT|mmetsp:Transcript_8472/g.9607  ORF Transcript_8472/g.9607 Transcript_8472/m.9607 type:complete len:101 (+) Transcript_8472:2-304(+)
MFGVIQNVGRFSLSSADKHKSIYSEEYTGNHVVIFENELQEPPSISLTNPNVEMWIKRHKINHKNWKIADVDNYMNGNKFFKNIMDSIEFTRFVDKYKDK